MPLARPRGRAVLGAILGNAGSLVAFRPGCEDARELAPYFAPRCSATDLLELPNFTAVGRLVLDGQPRPPFALGVRPSARPVHREAAAWVRAVTHKRHAASRAELLVEIEAAQSTED